MKSWHYKALFSLFLILPVFLLDADVCDSPFDVNPAIQHVNNHRNSMCLRESEFLIDTHVIYFSAPQGQYHSSIASDGTNYLVVWQDERGTSEYDIYGARVSHEGIILDPAGIVISTNPEINGHPSVAFDGTNYLVVWDYNYQIYGFNIFCARVNQDGVLLDTGAINLYSMHHCQYPSVAFDSTNYLVVWETGYGVRGHRVRQDGTIMEPYSIVISSLGPNDWHYAPKIAFDGTNYLVVWRNNAQDIYGARVSPEGIVIDTSAFAISVAAGDQRNPAVAFDGTNYAVVWSYNRSDSYDIYGARVNPSGIVIDTAGISISAASNDQEYPSVAFNGANYLVVWEDDRNDTSDIYGTLMTPGGIILDTSGYVISSAVSYQRSPIIVSDETKYFATWTDYRNLSSGRAPDVYGSRLDYDGNLLDTAGIAVSIDSIGNEQLFPSIADDGTNFLIVWQEGDAGWDSSYIVGARVSSEGYVLDSSRIIISGGPDAKSYPVAFFDGVNYVVAWRDYYLMDNDIIGARVSQDGIVIDSSGFRIAVALYNQTNPSGAFDGSNYFFVWEDYRHYYMIHPDIYGARVSTTGVLLDTSGIPISATSTALCNPAVIYDGTNYLVVWQEGIGADGHDIYGARVTVDGLVLDTPGIKISNTDYGVSPAVAFDGTNYLVVWFSAYDIWGARVTPEGVVVDSAGIPISTAAYIIESSPVVIFDGTDYIVMWQDNRNGDFDIYGARVSTAGTVMNSFPVSVQIGDQITPVVAQGAGTQLLVSYSRWTDTIGTKPVHGMRIWGKLVTDVGVDEDGGAETVIVKSNFIVYPNPSRKELCVNYNVIQRERIKISLYDVTGRLARELVNEIQDGGIYVKTIDVTSLPQGVYFVKLRSSSQSATRKIIFLK